MMEQEEGLFEHFRLKLLAFLSWIVPDVAHLASHWTTIGYNY